MKGNLKVIEVSKKSFLLKEKRTYKNVNLHCRDYNSHTLKLSNGKEVILSIYGMSIEANSLLLEADGCIAEEPATMLELRFYPQIEKSTN